MANLNFQQPPRSIANASLNSRQPGNGNVGTGVGSIGGGGIGVFGGSSLSGHVTPTSSMFSQNNANNGTAGSANNNNLNSNAYSNMPAQLSPSRQQQQQQMVGNVLGNLAGIGGLGGGGGGMGVSIGGGGPMQMSQRTSIFGQQQQQQQRPNFGSDRRPIQGLGSMQNMGSFMQSRGYGPQSGAGGLGGGLGSFHSVFGGGNNDTGTPPLLDLSEFPSLTNARGNDAMPQQSNALQPPGSKPYVGMVKQPTAEQTEFQMSSEDFPALPGTQINADGSMMLNSLGGLVGGNGTGNGGGGQGDQSTGDKHGSSSMGSMGGQQMGGGVQMGAGGQMNNGPSLAGGGASGMIGDMGGNSMSGNNGTSNNSATGHNSSGMLDMQASDAMTAAQNEKAMQRGVQTSLDGKVTNIPASMVNNQFGMVGLLTFIRAAETDQNLVTLAMGQDLTGLGLNLNSPDNLYTTFGGPFTDQPCRPQDIDFHVPPEYLVNTAIRDKLANMALKKYKDDLLFFLFYANAGDFMQVAAAAELHNRDWRFHMEEKVWITRVPGIPQYEKNGGLERGTFYYFDPQNWRRMPKDFMIDPGKLDKCPNLNNIISLSGQPV